MNIQTKQGVMEAMAWHIGRHVMIVTPGGLHFRVDGQPVREVYEALQILGKQAIEVDDHPHHYINMMITTTEDGCVLMVNDELPIELDHENHMMLLAVFETAFSQSTKGLDEMHEDEERRRYGLPPKEK